MVHEKMWMSPDEKIKKDILIYGKNSLKPSENSECVITISDTTYNVQKYNEFPVIIGESLNSFERLLDIVLTSMNEGEKAKITFKLKDDIIDFILELKTFRSNGFIFEWDAKKKFQLAQGHKDVGVSLFKSMSYVDASHRFSKAIKLLASIPIPVDEPPIEIDSLSVAEIYSFKTNLYNNLASCYLKNANYDIVIELCKRVLKEDPNNVKALYKIAVSYYEVHDYDKALDALKTVLKLEPENRAAAEKMSDFARKVKESNARVNAMVKKMFI